VNATKGGALIQLLEKSSALRKRRQWLKVESSFGRALESGELHTV
jgi:hypothetical protein